MHSQEIQADVRTVLNVAAHFSRLKERAGEMARQAAASKRGYFTPSEDEAVKHLLISYWQSRNALFELIVSYQRGKSLLTPEDEKASFLVAYAAALVLVDAARFLRDEFHELPLVRTKLNEPDPYFGVEPDTYERIQKSLTNPMHVWRLYHAAKYLDRNWGELKEYVDDSLRPVVDLIRKLQKRLNVDLEGYSLARVRVRARELRNAVEHGLFGQALYGIQKFIGTLIAEIFVRMDHVPTLRTDIASELRLQLMPGDVLITRKEYAVTNYFLPGFWPHAALYLGSTEQLKLAGIGDHDNLRPRWQKLMECDADEPLRVLEAMKDGVHIRSLKSPFGVDAITVLRPRLSPELISQAIARGFFHEGKPYDFDFDFNRSDRLVCTEVIYRSYEKIGGVEFQLTRRAGRWTLAAEDLIRMALERKHFEPFAVFSPSHCQSLAFGPEAERILRVTMKQANSVAT